MKSIKHFYLLLTVVSLGYTTVGLCPPANRPAGIRTFKDLPDLHAFMENPNERSIMEQRKQAVRKELEQQRQFTSREAMEQQHAQDLSELKTRQKQERTYIQQDENSLPAYDDDTTQQLSDNDKVSPEVRQKLYSPRTTAILKTQGIDFSKPITTEQLNQAKQTSTALDSEDESKNPYNEISTKLSTVHAQETAALQARHKAEKNANEKLFSQLNQLKPEETTEQTRQDQQTSRDQTETDATASEQTIPESEKIQPQEVKVEWWNIWKHIKLLLHNMGLRSRDISLEQLGINTTKPLTDVNPEDLENKQNDSDAVKAIKQYLREERNKDLTSAQNIFTKFMNWFKQANEDRLTRNARNNQNVQYNW